jgi:hypothetical protein
MNQAPNDSKIEFLSTNDVFMGHLLRLSALYSRLHSSNSQDSFYAMFPMNIRKRTPFLTDAYFGVAIATLVTEVDISFPASSGSTASSTTSTDSSPDSTNWKFNIFKAASQIRQQVQSFGSSSEVAKLLRFSTDRFRKEELKRLEFSVPKNPVLITNWTQFEIYQSGKFGDKTAVNFQFPASRINDPGALPPWFGVAVPTSPRHPKGEGGFVLHLSVPKELEKFVTKWDWTDPEAEHYQMKD